MKEKAKLNVPPNQKADKDVKTMMIYAIVMSVFTVSRTI